MKIMLWIRNEPIQIALANRVAEEHDLMGVVLENPRSGRITSGKIVDKITSKLSAAEVDRVWVKLQKHYSTIYPGLPESPSLVVDSINDEKTEEFTIKHEPDIVMVSGTQLVQGKLLALKLKHGIVNLHTGLSPYVKGGPNCTNWCLATGEYHLIGNTVMWIDQGIDTGNIITSETTEFSGNESLFDIHVKVIEHAHDLYLRALRSIEESPEKTPNKPQKEIGEGTVRYNNQWTASEKKALLKNLRSGDWKAAISSDDYRKKQESLNTIKLP